MSMCNKLVFCGRSYRLWIFVCVGFIFRKYVIAANFR